MMTIKAEIDKNLLWIQVSLNLFLLAVHVLRDSELPLEVASALGPEVQFVLKYIDIGEYKHLLLAVARGFSRNTKIAEPFL